MQRENLISLIQIDEETGATIVGRNTARRCSMNRKGWQLPQSEISSQRKQTLQLPEMELRADKQQAVAAIQTGMRRYRRSGSVYRRKSRGKDGL
ncbi:MAG: hypothetical protein ACLRYB_18140 [Segatella copri]